MQQGAHPPIPWSHPPPQVLAPEHDLLIPGPAHGAEYVFKRQLLADALLKLGGPALIFNYLVVGRGLLQMVGWRPRVQLVLVGERPCIPWTLTSVKGGAGTPAARAGRRKPLQEHATPQHTGAAHRL